MGLYLGSGEKMKIYWGGKIYFGNLYSNIVPITNGMRLLSLEEYILKDSIGIFITTTEEEEEE